MAAFISVASLLILAGVAAAQDPVAESRKLATSGQRDKALELLSTHLAQSPTDSDARTLYGTLLSWQGQYGEARTELEKVLTANPRSGDAMQALASVELWSDHPARAEELAATVLKDRPTDTDLLYTRARALIALNRKPEAMAVLSRLLELDPGDKDARRARDSAGEKNLSWDASVQYSYEWFDDGIGNRSEQQISLKGTTPVGSLIGRFSNAYRFGGFGNQMEADFYPGLRKGTYAYLNVGFSPDATLYPRYRFGGDIFQSLGHGFEGTGGYRRLGFSSEVNVFTTALTKYHGEWMFTARGYFTPDDVGTSASVHLSARRNLKDVRSYVEASWGHGGTPNEIRGLIDAQVLNSDSGGLSLYKSAGSRWSLNGAFTISHEERPSRPAIFHYTAYTGIDFRF